MLAAMLLAASLADDGARARTIARLDQLLDPAATAEARTDRVVVLSDHRAPDAARAMASRLEGAFAATREALGLPDDPAPPARLRVYAFRLRDAYIVAREAMGGLGDEDALVDPRLNLLVLHLDAGGIEDPRRVALREGVRWYLRARWPKGTPPPWLEEGLARHLAAGDLVGTRLVPRPWARSKDATLKAAPWPGAPEPPWTPSQLRRSWKSTGGPDLEGLFASERPEPGKARLAFDAASRFFLEFLRYGTDAWPDAARRVLEGAAPIDGPLDPWKARFVKYVEKID
jgi:hypothetical protein